MSTARCHPSPVHLPLHSLLFVIAIEIGVVVFVLTVNGKGRNGTNRSSSSERDGFTGGVGREAFHAIA